MDHRIMAVRRALVDFDASFNGDVAQRSTSVFDDGARGRPPP